MAEKEERILITTRHKDEKLNMNFTDMYKEYTRQEAINRMAKAFWPWNYTPSEIQSGKGWETMTDWERGGWLGLAKAALNSLLEGK